LSFWSQPTLTKDHKVIIDVWLIMLIYANGGALQNSAEKILKSFSCNLILLSVNGSFNLFQAVGKNHGIRT
jgi:hypothetical protein